MNSSTPHSGPTSLPEALESRLRLRLRHWGQRTALWGLILGVLAASTGWGKVVFILWVVFSALNLAGILFGLHMAKRLRSAAATATTGYPPQGGYPPGADRDVIEIEAEVVDSPPPADRA